MILKEFFGRSVNNVNNDKKETEEFSKDELFWSIIDDDQLHKKYFFPIARKIKKLHSKNKLDRSQCVQEFMPMVNQGCLKFSKKEKIFGKPSKLFPKEMREELAQRLFDHYEDDILKNRYNIGS